MSIDVNCAVVPWARHSFLLATQMYHQRSDIATYFRRCTEPLSSWRHVQLVPLATVAQSLGSAVAVPHHSPSLCHDTFVTRGAYFGDGPWLDGVVEGVAVGTHAPGKVFNTRLLVAEMKIDALCTQKI